MTVSHAVDPFLEPFTECAHSVRIRTDTALDQDLCTASNCAGVYSVHGRVIVDNKCGFQHSSSRGDCNFDERFASQTRKYRSKKKLRKHVCQLILVCTTQSVQAWSPAS